MINISKTVIFFGSGPVAAASLKALSGYFSIEAVITKAVPAHHKIAAPVESLAHDLDLPILFASTQSELDHMMQQQDFNSQVGIVIDYGVIMSESVIKKFERGIINSHFSLLPQWRGADPITFALLSGQPKTGVSLMLIEPALDTGKLIVQKRLLIRDDDTIHSLTNRLIELSNLLIEEYVPRYLAGELKPKNQPHPDRATYSRKITKLDGIVDWHKPAVQIEREIRAYLGWPQSRTTLGNVEVIITKAHVVSRDLKQPGSVALIDGLIVGTSHGSLAIDALKPLGKKEMPVKAFLAGYKHRLV